MRAISDCLILDRCHKCLIRNQQKENYQPSYLPRPANPFPNTEVDEDPGDGQSYCQWHSDLAWFFQAVGHLMHVEPLSQSSNDREKSNMQHWRLILIKLREAENGQYLTPRTPPQHWWGWWYQQWSSLCNIFLCSIDCYTSSKGGPEKWTKKKHFRHPLLNSVTV